MNRNSGKSNAGIPGSLSYGETFIALVGLPDAAVEESKDHVSTALANSGFKFPMGKTTINIAPADIKKEDWTSNYEDESLLWMRA